MQTSLLTPDGFPRSDLDVAQIRTTRARIVRLKNDYKWLMEKIEKGLHEHHANATNADTMANGGARRTTSERNQIPAPSRPIEAPFAKVNSIAASSPAEMAGLKVGDKIIKFGYVNFANHEKLTRVAQVVQANEGHEIDIKVLRPQGANAQSDSIELKLIPRHNWGGRGMLGCHLIPL